jgi:hypothetical protein
LQPKKSVFAIPRGKRDDRESKKFGETELALEKKVYIS